MALNLTELQNLIAAPYMGLFDQTTILLIVLAFLFFMMVILRLELGAILMFGVVIVAWLVPSTVGLAFGMGNIMLLLAIAGSFILLYAFNRVLRS